MSTTSTAVTVKRISWNESCVARRGSRHAYPVLTFQLAGELTVEHGGVFDLRAGDVHVIPAGDAHRIAGARGAEAWCAAIGPAALDRVRLGSLLAPLEGLKGGALPRVSIPEGRRAFMASLFAELAALAEVEGRNTPLRAESLAALVLAEIGDHAPASRAAPSRGSEVTARALRFIGENALAPLSLADVARGIGRNRSHVADVVRRDTGRSVGSWITELRLEEARRRLEQTDELIEVIGERVGYADSTHFTRTFKRRFGLTPRAWRHRSAGAEQ